MEKDHIAVFELSGCIRSVLNWNGQVRIELSDNSESTYCAKIPRKYCNPNKLKVGDMVRIVGNVADYNKENNKCSVIFARATVRKLLSKNSVNEKVDFTGDFSLVGMPVSARQVDAEFLYVEFMLANSEEHFACYVLKKEFLKIMESYDSRRLIHITGKISIISYHMYFLDVPISCFRNYVLTMEYI